MRWSAIVEALRLHILQIGSRARIIVRKSYHMRRWYQRSYSGLVFRVALWSCWFVESTYSTGFQNGRRCRDVSAQHKTSTADSAESLPVMIAAQSLEFVIGGLIHLDAMPVLACVDVNCHYLLLRTIALQAERNAETSHHCAEAERELLSIEDLVL